jgi:two-component system cell cycle response regulator
MIDLDFFKQVNDIYGHQAGDEVLRHFARLVKQSVRDSDYVSRYGGEEFVVILPETHKREARIMAERLRLIISEEPIPIGDQRHHLTASIGVAAYPDDADTWHRLLKKADAALYEAKKSGRDQVITV